MDNLGDCFTWGEDVLDRSGETEPIALQPGRALWSAAVAQAASVDGVRFGATLGATLPMRASAEPAGRRRRGWLVRRYLVAADVLGLAIAFAPVAAVVNGGVETRLGVAAEAAIFLAAVLLWIFLAKLYGLYDRDEERAAHSGVDEFVDLFHLITVGVWISYALKWIVGVAAPSARGLIVFWLGAIVAVPTMRAAARATARRRPGYRQNAIIVGAGDVGQLIGRKLLQHPEYGINLIGFVDGHPQERRADLGDLPLLGESPYLYDIIRENDIDRVIVAFSGDGDQELLDALHSLRRHELKVDDVQIDVVPRLFETLNPRVAIHTVEGLPLLGLPPVRIPRSSRFVKRGIDILVASALLILVAPLMAAIALLIRRDSPGPALFRQTRLGVDMREFTLLKFRTMRKDTDDAAHREYIAQIMDPLAAPTSRSRYKLERPDAVTRVGSWLRTTSLDELPQLFNVLRGDMSLVGPRPCIPYEASLFEPHHFERFLVPAGLTGLWQVEARAHSTFGEALNLDVLYARGWSLGLDLRLLIRTPFLILRRGETH